MKELDAVIEKLRSGAFLMSEINLVMLEICEGIRAALKEVNG